MSTAFVFSSGSRRATRGTGGSMRACGLAVVCVGGWKVSAAAIDGVRLLGWKRCREKTLDTLWLTLSVVIYDGYRLLWASVTFRSQRILITAVLMISQGSVQFVIAEGNASHIRGCFPWGPICTTGFVRQKASQQFHPSHKSSMASWATITLCTALCVRSLSRQHSAPSLHATIVPPSPLPILDNKKGYLVKVSGYLTANDRSPETNSIYHIHQHDKSQRRAQHGVHRIYTCDFGDNHQAQRPTDWDLPLPDLLASNLCQSRGWHKVCPGVFSPQTGARGVDIRPRPRRKTHRRCPPGGKWPLSRGLIRPSARGPRVHPALPPAEMARPPLSRPRPRRAWRRDQHPCSQGWLPDRRSVPHVSGFSARECLGEGGVCWG